MWLLSSEIYNQYKSHIICIYKGTNVWMLFTTFHVAIVASLSHKEQIPPFKAVMSWILLAQPVVKLFISRDIEYSFMEVGHNHIHR